MRKPARRNSPGPGFDSQHLHVKCSDIDDEHVIDLARAWSEAARRCWEIHPVPLMHTPGVVEALVLEGVPYKLARAKVMRLIGKRKLEYGSTPDCAWPATDCFWPTV